MARLRFLSEDRQWHGWALGLTGAAVEVTRQIGTLLSSSTGYPDGDPLLDTMSGPHRSKSSRPKRTKYGPVRNRRDQQGYYKRTKRPMH